MKLNKKRSAIVLATLLSVPAPLLLGDGVLWEVLSTNSGGQQSSGLLVHYEDGPDVGLQSSRSAGFELLLNCKPVIDFSRSRGGQIFNAKAGCKRFGRINKSFGLLI